MEERIAWMVDYRVKWKNVASDVFWNLEIKNIGTFRNTQPFPYMI